MHKTQIDFFVVGMPKAGTTSLWAALKENPRIFMPSEKEPHFYAPEYTSLSGHSSVVFPRYDPLSYDALFETAGTRQRGEASTHYLVSEVAASNIFSAHPDARIIAVLREPVAFLHSFHQHLCRSAPEFGETETDLLRALEIEDARSEGRYLPPGCQVPLRLQYSRHLRYAANLMRYLSRFSEKRVMIVLADDLMGDDGATLKRIISFVGGDVAESLKMPHLNNGFRVRNKFLLKHLHALSAGDGVYAFFKGIANRIIPQRVRRRSVSMVRDHILCASKPVLRPCVAEAIRQRFWGEVMALDSLLPELGVIDRWGYN